MKLMDISKVMPTIAVLAKKSMRTVEKSLPAILAGGAIGCLGGAVVMTAVGMHKADQKIADEENRRAELVPEYKNTKLTTKEKVQLTWMEFVPAAAFTTAAVTLIIMSKRKEHEKYLALMGAYELSRQALDERKEAESDVLSKDDLKLIEERSKQLSTGSIVPNDIPHVSNSGNEILYIESVTKTPFYATENDVLHAFNVMNHKIHTESRASVSDILDDLGLRTSRASDTFEWTDCWFELGSVVEPFFRPTFLDSDPSMPATLIEYSVDPRVVD